MLLKDEFINSHINIHIYIFRYLYVHRIAKTTGVNFALTRSELNQLDLAHLSMKSDYAYR